MESELLPDQVAAPGKGKDHDGGPQNLCTGCDRVIILDQAAFGENVLPVMESIGRLPAGGAPHQGKDQRPCIVDIGCQVQVIFTVPPEAYRSAERVPCLQEEHQAADQGNNQLAQ